MSPLSVGSDGYEQDCVIPHTNTKILALKDAQKAPKSEFIEEEQE